jgi:dCMP deaminase
MSHPIDLPQGLEELTHNATILQAMLAKYKPNVSDKLNQRLSWQEYFLSMAFMCSIRSIDQQTKHGCVLTDYDHHIIGTGYNGPCGKIDDHYIPVYRPDKYVFMLHAEENAIANSNPSPWSLPQGAVAYITGKPCLQCLMRLINAHVTTIYAAQRQGTVLEDKHAVEWDFIRNSSAIKYIEMPIPEVAMPLVNWGCNDE